MPRRQDLKSILLIGSGPIVIGQGAEFDYSGTQACKALREEGFRVVLVNSNPATIMTDPDFADATYVEPLTVPFLEKIIAKERPDALLPTLGGQTALNLAVALHEAGILAKYNVQLIGASLTAIHAAEDRQQFKTLMIEAGLELPQSGVAHTVEEARAIVNRTGLPAVLRPSFTLGGLGGGIARTPAELDQMVAFALQVSPAHSVLLEESVLGWKEYELEVMRDRKDNVVIICSIENLDPMGVHTGDSITVAPALTLTDREYQRMRDAAITCIRKIGVETGGSNVQFAVNPKDGRMVIIEMNPRVSRSSALASKATGYPIARIAAKLAVGYTLDEIPNAIVNPGARNGARQVAATEATPSPRASFEPSIDYIVVKSPRFVFEKFPGAAVELTTSMKSVGEAMSMGRTFKEALQKVLRSMEVGSAGLEPDRASRREARLAGATPVDKEALERHLVRPNPERIWLLARALREGYSVARLHTLTGIDPWFLNEMAALVADELALEKKSLKQLDAPQLRTLKSRGFSDRRLGELVKSTEDEVRAYRHSLDVRPTYKRVDTCAAEFEAQTPYLYSTYEKPMVRHGKPVDADESNPTQRRKVVILGSGPIRIGQGIEFDYCCVHASMALQKMGVEVIMLNCNPETVSTDHDTSDRLYFEPLTLEDVLEVIHKEKPEGVVVQFGGQTPLKLAKGLLRNGVKILGTQADAIDRAEDRKRSSELVDTLGLKQPRSGLAHTLEEARVHARNLGFPLMVRPSYVLGGRAMEVVHNAESLERYVGTALDASPDHPVYMDGFLENAIELDVDVLCDGKDAVVVGCMEHVEEAGIHSGDSACSLPPYSLGNDILEQVKAAARAMALELNVLGLMNAQFAVQGKDVFVLEMNPRASRTVPFVAKATGLPIPQLATQVIMGKTLKDLAIKEPVPSGMVAVKEAVFPFIKFPGVDTVLGPEMKSTGECMGFAPDFPTAFFKAQLAAGQVILDHGNVLITVADKDKPAIIPVARTLHTLGYTLMATAGTARALEAAGVPCKTMLKMREGSPNGMEAIRHGRVAMVINTTGDPRDRQDSAPIRREALQKGVAYFTTLRAAQAMAAALEQVKKTGFSVRTIQGT
jgi:carbamoyl-phosphate synthase large subunit